MVRQAGLLTLLIVTLGLIASCTRTVTEHSEITLSSGQYMTIPVNLKAGDLIDGSVTVVGGTNLDIAFAIQDPNGRNATDLVRKRSHNFTYRARQDGIHHLYLDNTYSLLTGKIVSLTFKHPIR